MEFTVTRSLTMKGAFFFFPLLVKFIFCCSFYNYQTAKRTFFFKHLRNHGLINIENISSCSWHKMMAEFRPVIGHDCFLKHLHCFNLYFIPFEGTVILMMGLMVSISLLSSTVKVHLCNSYRETRGLMDLRLIAIGGTLFQPKLSRAHPS